MRIYFPRGVTLTDEELARADAEAIRRDKEDRAAGLKDQDSAAYQSPETNNFHSRQACRAELAVSILTGLPWTGEGQRGMRKRDVGDRYEVKWSGKPRLYIRPRNKVGDYIATTGDGKTIRVIGWWHFNPLRDYRHLTLLRYTEAYAFSEGELMAVLEVGA